MRLELGAAVVDTDSGEVQVGDRRGPLLTPLECRILDALVQAGDEGRSYERLLQEVWGIAEGGVSPGARGEQAARIWEANKNRVQRAMTDLRRKLHPSNAIVTLHGAGYRLVEVEVGPDRAESRWPAELPSPGPEARALIDRALALAAARAHDHLGVEHLALALPEIDGGGALTTWMRARARGMAAALSQDGLSPDPLLAREGGAPQKPQPTPRLRRLAGLLGPGFGLDALWRVICGDARQPLHLYPGELHLIEGDQTVSRTLSRGPVQVGRLLEVVGGPEDGRQLAPRPGDTIGRRSPQAPPVHVLYERSFLVDPALSRRHLVWLGQDRVSVSRRVDRTRGAERVALPPGEHQLEPGDLLHLTPHTLLWLLNGDGLPGQETTDVARGN